MEEVPRMHRGHVPPHRHSRHSSLTSTINLNTSLSPQDTQDTVHNAHAPPEVSRLEKLAVELYGQTLLSRAHFLLFNSLRTDSGTQNDFLDEGKRALEEAESLCMSDECCIRDKLLAKCNYIRGFLADISGDEDTALRCFLEATEQEKRYGDLGRVAWYLQRHGDANGLVEMWWKESSSSLGQDAVDELAEYTRRSKEQQTQSQRSSRDILWTGLLHEVQHLPHTMPGSSSSDETQISRSGSQSTRQSVILPESPGSNTGLVDDLLYALRNRLEEPERHSPRRPPPPPEIRQALRTGENGVDGAEAGKDPFVALWEGRSQAEGEAGEREQLSRAHGSTLQSKRPSTSSVEEALLSDALSISELDERRVLANRGNPGALRSPKLSISIPPGSRRPSLTSRLNPVSPALPSPLRKASLPGDGDMSGGSADDS